MQRVLILTLAILNFQFQQIVSTTPSTQGLVAKPDDWSDWSTWNKCSVKCGIGNTTRVRFKVNQKQVPTTIDYETRRCMSNIDPHCAIPDYDLWQTMDMSKILSLVLIFLPVFLYIVIFVQWQRSSIGNLWSFDRANRIVPSPQMGQLTPSQQILHAEMMRNFKILQMKMQEQQKVDNQMKEMESLKDNLLSLGLV